MPSIYEFDAATTSRHSLITLKDIHGNEYRVQISNQGGFVITKSGANLVDAISVHPVCANEIRIA